MNNYKHEETKLFNHIGNDDVVKLLKEAKCFIAGGAITSIFSNKEINDYEYKLLMEEQLKNLDYEFRLVT